ncbi:unnamed protein product [Fraxinus pennsylvanica]|uniref:Uncharacterized protein n=1 Tax=Fraxinus pennsylvanica TaxID=56036 RepID=A0AAD2AI51_9LAMI|nr:unnamed protein product [Fraxinus pennsylvanica]
MDVTLLDVGKYLCVNLSRGSFVMEQGDLHVGWELVSQRLKDFRKCIVLPIGSISTGLCRHRAIFFEVSSLGIFERIVWIPQDLDRFKGHNMYVKYVTEIVETGLSSEHDGVFKLISFDSEANNCTWGLENVRVIREKARKGRPLGKNRESGE